MADEPKLLDFVEAGEAALAMIQWCESQGLTEWQGNQVCEIVIASTIQNATRDRMTRAVLLATLIRDIQEVIARLDDEDKPKSRPRKKRPRRPVAKPGA